MGYLKILVDVSAIDEIYQGTSTHIFQLYKAINQLDSNISLYLISHNKEKQLEYFSEFKNTTFLQYKSKNKLIQLYYEMPKILEKINPDFAHFQYITPLKSKIKYIVTIHDLLIFSHTHFFTKSFAFPRKLLYNYSIKNAEIVASVSDYTSKALKEKYVKANIVTTPNAVNTFANKLDRNSAKDYIKTKFKVQKYILYVSRFEHRKNHNFLLKAFEELDLLSLGYSLVFIGSGVKNEFSNEQKSFLHLVEAIDESDLYSFYKAAELFVYPSLAEGFGIPPLEALSEGTKVICSNATALEEFDFLKEVQFNPENLEDLKSLMSSVLENNKDIDWVQMQNLAKQKYSWELSAQNLLKALNQA